MSKIFQSRGSTPESSFSLHYRSRCFRDLKRFSIQRQWGFRLGGNLNLQIRRILHGGGERNIWAPRSLTRRTKKLVKASILISSPWETGRNLGTSVAARLCTSRPYRSRDSEWRCQGTVISRKKAPPEERYWYMPSFEERDDSPPGVWWKKWRVRRVHRRANDLSKENRKQGEWTEASFEEKTPSYKSLCPTSARSLLFWRKSYVLRGVKGAMFAVK